MNRIAEFYAPTKETCNYAAKYSLMTVFDIMRERYLADPSGKNSLNLKLAYENLINSVRPVNANINYSIKNTADDTWCYVESISGCKHFRNIDDAREAWIDYINYQYQDDID